MYNPGIPQVCITRVSLRWCISRVSSRVVYISRVSSRVGINPGLSLGWVLIPGYLSGVLYLGFPLGCVIPRVSFRVCISRVISRVCISLVISRVCERCPCWVCERCPCWVCERCTMVGMLFFYHGGYAPPSHGGYAPSLPPCVYAHPTTLGIPHHHPAVPWTAASPHVSTC